MYDVLIVDDEPLARESLKYLIDWEEHGFRVGAEAEDGLRALELMREQYFSLVLTDIRMPRLNGLEFIGRMKEFCDVPAVILSGYDDFDYARQGIQLGVQDYLLKPVDEDDLVALLRRVGTEIAERGRDDRRRERGLRAYRDDWLRRAAHGQLSASELRDEAGFAGVDWDGKRAIVLLADAELDDALPDRELELKRFAARNVAEEWAAGRGYVFEESEDTHGVVLLFDPDADTAGCSGSESPPVAPLEAAESKVMESKAALPEADSLEALAALEAVRLAEALRSYAKIVVTIGIGTAEDDPGAGGLGRSYREARRALDGKFLRGEGSILRSGQPSRQPRDGDAGWRRFEALEEELLDAVRSYDAERMREATGELGACAAAEALPAEPLRYELLGLLVRLYRQAKTAGVDLDSRFDRRAEDYEAVTGAKTIGELMRFLSAKCEDVLEALKDARELKPNKVAAEVAEIVRGRYAEDITLRGVAQQVYLNPNYLGKLFKASTGRSFNEYLLEVRMEKAKELLLHSDLRIYEIARQVGYEELDWFYKKFKAYANVSAGEFRARSER